MARQVDSLKKTMLNNYKYKIENTGQSKRELLSFMRYL